MHENARIAVVAELGAEQKSEMNDLMRDIGVKAGRIDYIGEPFIDKIGQTANTEKTQAYQQLSNQVFQSLDLTDYDTLFLENKDLMKDMRDIPF